MAFTFAQTNLNSTATLTTLSQAYGSNTSLGSVLIVSIGETGTASAATISDTLLNVWNPINNNGNQAWWWAKNKSSGANTVTATHTSDTINFVQILEYTVTGSIAPTLFANASAVNATTTSITVGPLSGTGELNDLFVHISMSAAATTYTDTWASSTLRQGSSSSLVYVADKTATNGAQTATATAALSSTFGNALLVFVQNDALVGSGGVGGSSTVWYPNPLTSSINF